MSLLEVRGLVVRFGDLAAVDNVSLAVEPGETLAVVGESGCGKTTLARAVLGLQKTESGTVTIQGRPVQGVARGQASVVGMVWQDPFASLDPRWSVGDILAEPFVVAGREPDTERLLVEIGLDASMAKRYPHQLSGGQRQRVAIGRALALRPPLVICDEPTAALDLSMQAQILNLLRDLQKTLGCAVLYISHDLTTVRFLADRVAVMYKGQIVETGDKDDVFDRPMHPYTAALLASAPSLDVLGQLPKPSKGEVGALTNEVGCRFAPRCGFAQPKCSAAVPAVADFGGHTALCLFPLEPVATESA